MDNTKHNIGVMIQPLSRTFTESHNCSLFVHGSISQYSVKTKEPPLHKEQICLGHSMMLLNY